MITEGSLKSNFRQFGQLEKQRWEESEKRREQNKIREEKESEKGRKVAKHCVCPMVWGSTGLATAAFATFLACLLPKCLLGLKLSFFYGSESDVRQCGLWPGTTS